jgi:hypothetical protein
VKREMEEMREREERERERRRRREERVRGERRGNKMQLILILYSDNKDIMDFSTIL